MIHAAPPVHQKKHRLMIPGFIADQQIPVDVAKIQQAGGFDFRH
jgi:hypothetical protein